MMFKLSTSLLLWSFLGLWQAHADPYTNQGCVLDHTAVQTEQEINVDVKVGWGQNDGYFNLNFIQGQFNGMTNVKAWCIDIGRFLSKGVYSMDFYSSMNYPAVENPGAVNYPGNFGAVNFLINNYPVGTSIDEDGCGPFTVQDADFQVAVWGVIDNHSSPENLIKGERMCIVNFLKSQALANTDFVPNCRGAQSKIGVILIVDDSSNNILNQVILAEIPYAQTGICSCKNNQGCTLDHTAVEIDDNKEIAIRVINAETRKNDGYLKVNFKKGLFKNYDSAKTWCVDLDRDITSNRNYHVDIFSTLDYPGSYNPGAVDKPDNLGAINYLMNHYPINTVINEPNCGPFQITDDEFQIVIWKIVDSAQNPEAEISGGGEACVVDYLYNQAMTNTRYEPDCKNRQEKFAILLIVDDEDSDITHQVLVSEVSLRSTRICDCDDRLAFGDPHISTWTGERYDFHGVCDLVLLTDPGFDNGIGIDIHIRSKRTRMWSYVSAAAVRIGRDILEVIGGKNENQFWINGVKNEAVPDKIATESKLSGYPIVFEWINTNERHFMVDLGDKEEIRFKTWNAFVSVSVRNAKFEHFGKSVGLMGSFETGKKVARDNKTIIHDNNILGQEWQVLASEAKLFHDNEGPQQPNKCDIPDTSEMRRRLGEHTATIEDAERACATVQKKDMEPCVFDVMATNDMSSAGAY